jgi:hypothetical protein
MKSTGALDAEDDGSTLIGKIGCRSFAARGIVIWVLAPLGWVAAVTVFVTGIESAALSDSIDIEAISFR